MSSSRPRFDAERAKAAAARIRYNEIRDALAAVRVRSQSPDRSVTVELGPGGAVLDIVLAPEALRHEATALARLLVETINSGVAQIAAQTNEAVAPFLSGSDLNLAAITAGRLPPEVQRPPKNDWEREIEEASAIPKGPLGSYRRTGL